MNKEIEGFVELKGFSIDQESFDKIKINLFGESWSLKKLELDDSLKLKLDSCSVNSSEKLTDQLLDLSFYEKLALPGINSIADLPGSCIKGLMNLPNSQLEIWRNGRKLRKLKLIELFNQYTLFDLYQTEVEELSFEDLGAGIYVIEKEIGLIASFNFLISNFNINFITFIFLRLNYNGKTVEIFKNIRLKDELLESSQSDSVITSAVCIEKFK